MSTATATGTHTGTHTGTALTPTTARRFALLRSGSAAGAVAAVATALVAVSAHAAGVSFADRTGQSIPAYAFAQLTFVGALLGVALAAALRRRASQPRRTFTRAAWTMAALSCVAPTLIGVSAASVAVLVADHLLAAAIVIPWIASRLPR